MVYFLAFLGMVCWGISPIFAKIGLKDINPLLGLSIRTLFTALVVLIWLFFSGNMQDLKFVSARTICFLILEAIVAMLFGDLAYFSALKQGSASIVMIIMACSPLITIVCSIFLLNERLTFTHILGACFAVIGLILIV